MRKTFYLLGFGLLLSVSSCAQYPLCAVLVVGPQEDGTTAAMESMERVADMFLSEEIEVKRFYNRQAIWANIVHAATSADFFVYSGHGSTMGEGGSAGGLCIDQHVDSKMIREELRLRPNAIVLFQSVCGGAGSSASDDGDIGLKEARLRVSSYAKPFIEGGASAYFAININAGLLSFLREFFDGKHLYDCFEFAAQTWTRIEPSVDCAYKPGYRVHIASTNWGGTTTRTTWTNGRKTVETFPRFRQYDIACVGSSEYSFQLLTKGR